MSVDDSSSRDTSSPSLTSDQDGPSKSSTATASSRPFRRLLPQPPATAPTSTLPSRPRPPYQVLPRPLGSCGIPQCKKTPCTSATHHQYDRALRKARSSRTAAAKDPVTAPPTSSFTSQQLSSQTSITSTPAPQLALDSLFSFPFETQYTHEFHRIFNFYVNHYFDLIYLVFQYPVTADYKADAIQELLSSEMKATIALAHSKSHLMLQNSDRSQDAVCNLIYGQLVQILRRRLEDVQDADVDDLIICVVALSNLDLLLGKPESLGTHRTAIQHLVASRGGVHNLGKTLPVIMQTDRRLAVLTGTYPMFGSPPPPSVELTLPPASEYGASFPLPQLARIIDPDILLFCRDECRLIGLFERSEISFDMDRPSQGDQSRLPLFFFCRDQLSAHFAYLHAQYRQDKEKSWCLLMVTKLVEYPIVMGGIMSMLTEYIALELTDWLKEEQRTGRFADWEGLDDLLTWMFWVLATLEVPWEGKEWAQGFLKDRLSTIYSHGGRILQASSSNAAKGKGKQIVWEPAWRQLEWQKNKRWMWSNKHLRRRFDALCDRFEDDS